MELKHFRDCKKRLQKATQEMQRITDARAKRDNPAMLHEEIDKEVQDAKDAEEMTKKKPAGKKGAVEAPPPPPRWDELDAMARYRRLYSHMRTSLDDSTFHVIPCDASRDATMAKINEQVPVATLAAESAASTERARAEAAKAR